jgi:hypothetical protein
MIARIHKSACCPPQESMHRRRRSQESGFAYLMAMFLVLVMIVASQVALRNMYTQGQRAREDDMIWRGNQYVRAIRLYFRKTGHYPQDLDALQTGLPELHFLRYAAYKDPMNKSGDGAWRFIYVNGAGQIIGSVRYATLQQMAIMDLNGGQIPPVSQMGALVGTPVSSMASGTGGAGTVNAPGQQGAPAGTNAPGQPSSGSATDNSAGGAQAPAQAPAQTSSSSSGQLVNPLALLKPTGPVDGPVIGAFLSGVGGGTHSDAASIKVYNGGKKYKDWEFIWNPLEDQARAVQQGLTNPGPAVGVPAGAVGNGNANPVVNPPGFGGALVPPSSQPPPQNP